MATGAVFALRGVQATRHRPLDVESFRANLDEVTPGVARSSTTC